MKNASITIKINEKEKAKLVSIAKKKDIPVSQLIRECCKEILNKEDQN